MRKNKKNTKQALKERRKQQEKNILAASMGIKRLTK